MSSYKMFSWKLALATTVLSLGLAGQAQAMVGVGLKGGLGMSKSSGGSGSSYGMGYLGGLSFDFGMGPITLGADVLYAARTFGATGGSVKLNQVHVPVQAKFNLAPMVFLSAGGYYAMALSDGFANDYGAVGGLGVSFGGITVEGRYNRSFGDLDGSTHLEALVGYRF